MASSSSSLLRRVETHVRIMAGTEHFTAREPNPYDGAALTFAHQPSGGDNKATTYKGFSKVHLNSTDNGAFFADTVAKLASHATAGQSSVVLLCGPPASGRSQTLYNVPRPGLLHLMASELLRLEKASGSANALTLFTAFHVRGGLLQDTLANDQEVALRRFDTPFGATPESSFRLLERAEDAVCVPKGKVVSSSCFVQFHVYTPLGVANPNLLSGNPNAPARKDAFATITFVDLAGFNDVTPVDVQALSECLRRHLDGSDAPNWGQCKLTEILETCLLGSREIVCIPTLVGKKDLYPAAHATLRFAETLGRLQHAPKLVHLATPRWWVDIPHTMQTWRAHRDRTIALARQRGCAEVYGAFCRVLEAKLAELRTAVSCADADIEEVRQIMQAEADARAGEMEAHSHSAKEAMQEAERARDSLEQQCHRLQNALQDARDRHREAEGALFQEQSTENDKRAEEQEHLSDARFRRMKRQREIADCERRRQSADEAAEQHAKATERAWDHVTAVSMKVSYDAAMRSLGEKKRRLEQRLEGAAAAARAKVELAKEDRQRRSRAAQLTAMEHKVVAKKNALLRQGSGSMPPLTNLPTNHKAYTNNTNGDDDASAASFGTGTMPAAMMPNGGIFGDSAGPDTSRSPSPVPLLISSPSTTTRPSSSGRAGKKLSANSTQRSKAKSRSEKARRDVPPLSDVELSLF